MLSARKAMDVVSVYLDVGSFNAAGEICGVDPKKVKQIVAVHEAGGLEEGGTRRRRLVAKNTDVVRDLVARRVSDRRARITAERLLPKARAAGYGGVGSELPPSGGGGEESVANPEWASASPGGVGAG